MAKELDCEENQRTKEEEEFRTKNRVMENVEQGDLKFTYGNLQGRECIIVVDGGWKQMKRKSFSKAGIGWVAKIGMDVLFSGNCMIKANSTLQCEGLTVLKAIKEAQSREEVNIN